MIGANSFSAIARDLVDAYISLIDTREFESWLALFADDCHYTVLRRTEYDAGNNLVLVGEDAKRLRGRITSGESRDRRRTVHTVGWIRDDEATQHITAAFTIWFDGLPGYAGIYEFALVSEGASWRIKACAVILDNQMIKQTIYLPI